MLFIQVDSNKLWHGLFSGLEAGILSLTQNPLKSMEIHLLTSTSFNLGTK